MGTLDLISGVVLRMHAKWCVQQNKKRSNRAGIASQCRMPDIRRLSDDFVGKMAPHVLEMLGPNVSVGVSIRLLLEEMPFVAWANQDTSKGAVHRSFRFPCYSPSRRPVACVPWVSRLLQPLQPCQEARCTVSNAHKHISPRQKQKQPVLYCLAWCSDLFESGDCFFFFSFFFTSCLSPHIREPGALSLLLLLHPETRGVEEPPNGSK